MLTIGQRFFGRKEGKLDIRCVLVSEGDTLESIRADSICTDVGKHYTVQKEKYTGGALYVMCKCGVHHITDAEVSSENPSVTFAVVHTDTVE